MAETKTGFDKPLRAEKLLKRRWKVLERFSYLDKKGKRHWVPRAYVTDLASVPRAFWWLFPPDGDYTQAAVLHDRLCESKIIPYKRAHEIFKEAMIDLGVDKIERNLMAWAVKHFGPRW